MVGGDGPSLLGRDWLSKIKLNWEELHHIDQTKLTLEAVLDKRSKVFRDELGMVRGVTAKLHIDPQARPKFYRPRSVPYAMKDKVEQELDHLHQQGIIEPVQFSEWVAPIVPVLKQNGDIRICGDYKLTVNAVAKLDTYPLPRIEDLFTSLSGGKYFSKLDLAQAYPQLPLDEASRKYVTINTQKGLYQYTRLPFGVASVPSVFQKTMDNLLQGIEKVCVYLDDILITGATEAEHLRNLQEVLSHLEQAGMHLKKLSSGCLETKLCHFLFQYRITPHTTTSQSPAQLLLGRQLRSHLDQLHSDLASRVEHKQELQKQSHDQQTKMHQFVPDEGVFVRNFAQGDPWLAGTIVNAPGPRSYNLKLFDNRMVRHHVDHIRAHSMVLPESSADNALDETIPITVSDSNSPAHNISPLAPLRHSTRISRPPNRLIHNI